MDNMNLIVPTEIRQVGDTQRIIGTIIQEGRAASERLELFAPNSIQWSANGIDILDAHRGNSLANAMPRRQQDGRITVAIPADSRIMEVREAAPYLSIEFIALSESTRGDGVREINQALVTGAAFVPDPEYTQATTEVRNKRLPIWL